MGSITGNRSYSSTGGMDMQRISKHRTGKRIQKLMAERGITVREMQEQMELESAQAVYKWIHGQALPTTENMLMIARILNVPMEELILTEDDGEWKKEWNRMHPHIFLAYYLYLDDPVRRADAERFSVLMEDIRQEREMSVAAKSVEKVFVRNTENICNRL